MPAVLTVHRLEKRISIQGPDFNNLVKSLADQGVRYDENTKLYYDLAGEYFSRRYDEGFRLAESLWQNKKSNRWTSAGAPRKRVQINPLVRPINTTTRGDRQLTGGGLSLQQIAAGETETNPDASCSHTESNRFRTYNPDCTRAWFSPRLPEYHRKSNTWAWLWAHGRSRRLHNSPHGWG